MSKRHKLMNNYTNLIHQNRHKPCIKTDTQGQRTLNCQKATAEAAATFNESTLWLIGMRAT